MLITKWARSVMAFVHGWAAPMCITCISCRFSKKKKKHQLSSKNKLHVLLHFCMNSTVVARRNTSRQFIIVINSNTLYVLPSTVDRQFHVLREKKLIASLKSANRVSP